MENEGRGWKAQELEQEKESGSNGADASENASNNASNSTATVGVSEGYIHPWIGLQIQSNFQGQERTGKVVGYSAGTGDGVGVSWSVQYTDGSGQEDMVRQQMQKCIQVTRKKRGGTVGFHSEMDHKSSCCTEHEQVSWKCCHVPTHILPCVHTHIQIM